MEIVSEVDRKFFANNMLSNEDWEASMELSDIMGLEDNLPNIDLLPDVQQPSPLQDSIEDDFMTYFQSVNHDDLLNDWSDSSDSGISGVVGVQSPSTTIKSEPLSPTSPYFSDSCDSSVSMLFTSQDQPIVQQQLPLQQPHQTVLHSDIIKVEPVSYSNPSSPTATFKSSIPVAPTVQINSILNSQIKIQPKPEQGTVPEVKSPQKRAATTTQGPVRSQKSLVLSAAEFQRLTNSGLLRLQPPSQESLVKCPVTAPTITVPQTVPYLGITNTGIEDKDAKVVKRQQRMIKNRESASLSRKRKKEYMSGLEMKLQEFSSENEKLRQENLALKRKLSDLNYENENLKKTFTVSPAIKKTCLLSMFILLTLNLGAWSGIQLTANTGTADLSSTVIHKGRQLLTVREQEVENTWSLPEDTVDKLHSLILEYGGARGSDGGVNITDVPPMCPTYFNKTESMRLAEQLAGWMYSHEEEKKKAEKKQRKGIKEKELSPLSTLRRAMREDVDFVHKKYLRSLDASNQLQLYGGADTGRDFLKAIHRRNDTFYVLSFDEDYYLVPAVYHNKTSRPRMSLVMPALALNESMSPPEGQVGMMQVDCEVMNTQLIHVQKVAIPRHVRDKHNNSYTRYDNSRSYSP